MSYRTTRNLQIIAVILFGIALLAVLFICLMQAQIKATYTSDVQVLDYRTIPVLGIISGILYLAFAVVYLILLCSHSSGLKGFIIAYVITIGVISILNIPLSYLQTSIVARQGTIALASHSMLNSAISMTNPINIVARMLTFLSMLGAFGKNKTGDQSLMADS